MSNRVVAGWSGYLDCESNVCHIVPDEDAIVHEWAEDCVCRPVTRTEGDQRLDMVYHTALDGRSLAPKPPKVLVISIPLPFLREAAGVAGIAGLAWWLAKPWRVRWS